jgi:hypothetical protein
MQRGGSQSGGDLLQTGIRGSRPRPLKEEEEDVVSGVAQSETSTLTKQLLDPFLAVRSYGHLQRLLAVSYSFISYLIGS